MVPRTTVLLVEDHPLIATDAKQTLERFGCRVLGPCATLGTSRAALQHDSPDFAIVDLSLPDGDGLELVRELCERGVACAIFSGVDRGSVLAREPLPVYWIDKLEAVDGIQRVLFEAGFLDDAPA